MNLEVGLRLEGADLFLALDEDRECRGLHAADGGELEATLSGIHGGEGAGAVDADKPVALGTADGGGGERLHLRVVAKVGEAFLDRLLGHRLEPEALDRLLAAGELDDVVENQLSLASGVAGVDDGGDPGVLQKFLHHLKAVGGSGDRLKLELLGNNGEGIELPREPLAARHLVRQAELHQMAHRRGDDVVVDLEELGSGGFSTQSAGQIGGDARLLGNDEGFGHQERGLG